MATRRRHKNTRNNALNTNSRRKKSKLKDMKTLIECFPCSSIMNISGDVTSRSTISQNLPLLFVASHFIMDILFYQVDDTPFCCNPFPSWIFSSIKLTQKQQIFLKTL
jgi:hypothetical protein